LERVVLMNKYGAKKTVIDGHTFPSRREAEYYLLYKSMLQRKEIVNLELQPSFILIPRYVNKAGKKIRECKYTADFMLTYPSGRKVVVEVKGYRTRDYQLRRKMFEYKYREYEFMEVR
jgi:hypothetical protein